MSVTEARSPGPKVREELQSQLEYIGQSKFDHGYSKGVNRLFELALRYVEDAEEAYHAGHRAAWCFGVWDAPLFYACDTIPVSITELGRLGSAEAMTIGESLFQLPKETCSMVSSSLGEWFLRRDTSVKRIVALNGMCEPYNMAFELIKDHGYDLYRLGAINKPLIDLGGREEQMVRYFAAELADLAQWLTGKPIDETRLKLEIRRGNRILAKVRQIMALRVQNPLYIKSLATMYLLMGSGHYYGKPKEFEETLDLLIEEMKTAAFVPAPKGRVVPLAWIGARGQEFGVYKAIDDCGGAMLGWVTPNAIAYDWREDVPPLESMARYVLDSMAVGSPVHLLKFLDAVIKGSGSKGIFFYCYVGCSFGGVYIEMIRDYFHKKGVPSIFLEGTFQVGPPSGQLLTRVRAFVEMFS
jgi:benzoyl-CoA reductase/2-hydroxyglutaryl-CoA dehydratase subunit BcrC/BadD/HgdB